MLAQSLIIRGNFMIKIFDCTLREGGYVNDWNFQYSNIKKILSNLVLANIDYVECGFLKSCDYNNDKTLFSAIEDLQNLEIELKKTKLALMVNLGEYPIERFPYCNDENIFIRIAFKKNQIKEAIDYSKILKEKGYNIFLNPMHTITYSSNELLDLINLANNLKPKGFTIVDTTGEMREKDLVLYFNLIDSNLDKDISLGFHSHNNLQLSFSNSQCLLKICKDRELIIDTTISGIGRGAGNLCTELIIRHLNDNYNKNYDINPIIKIIDEQINPIFKDTPCGYSIFYYLSAVNSCHPNYAKYLMNKGNLSLETIDYIFKRIPQNKKLSFDIDLIEKLFADAKNN